MTALCIVLGILLLLTLVMLIKIELFATYNEALMLKVKVLFVTLDIIPKKKNNKKKSKKAQKTKPTDQKPKTDKKDKKQKKPNALSRLREQRGISGIVAILTELAKIATTTLNGVVRHIVIHRFDVDITVVGDDAADTALKYGKLCGAVYSAVAVIMSTVKCDNYTVDVTPDFDDNAKSTANCDMHCHIRVSYIVAHGIVALVRLLWLRLKN